MKERVENGGRNAEICRYLMNYANYPVYGDGEVTYYPSGKEMFKDMLAAVEKAERFILAEYFIIAGGKMWDTFRELLLKKADEGVQTRLVFDDVGQLDASAAQITTSISNLFIPTSSASNSIPRCLFSRCA